MHTQARIHIQRKNNRVLESLNTWNNMQNIRTTSSRTSQIRNAPILRFVIQFMNICSFAFTPEIWVRPPIENTRNTKWKSCPREEATLVCGAIVLRSTGLKDIVGDEGKKCLLKTVPSWWYFGKLYPNIACVEWRARRHRHLLGTQWTNDNAMKEDVKNYTQTEQVKKLRSGWGRKVAAPVRWWQPPK